VGERGGSAYIRKIYTLGRIPTELQKLSDTRWSCRYVACRVARDKLYHKLFAK